MAAAFEDVRMTRLRQAMAKTVDGTIGGVSLEEFLSCFPDLSQTHEGILSELYTQFNEAVRSNVMVRPSRPPRGPAPPRAVALAAETGFRTLQPTSLTHASRVIAHCSKSSTKFARRRTW